MKKTGVKRKSIRQLEGRKLSLTQVAQIIGGHHKKHNDDHKHKHGHKHKHDHDHKHDHKGAGRGKTPPPRWT